ncbi:FtsQ-type POTRA domain-containing protein [Candidatus Liberibacter asiaticus]|uniref:Cell division protein FtsQ n=3 Tax=Liberibacter asiaticus TaxID=34021 RepID=C6XGZ8_LIBAP|nr:FtsQ-type POTRA domain-containing protein [Candidatus Liberibacter asiaticus]ACT57651.1 cell division protein [Candidatus Liberibacter asiaticus str. psy62]AGH17411.1 cell division protein [Candidatus Liberibacter asiaticus str. gxpsy]ALK07685.1 FtsQ-type POTRA domain-containing protein [Candidatus Liberibacter asiaticus]ASK53180.1 cell division protein [Candidatus Liberibacter asiaticus]AWL14498.1 cell division protein [Candidatus Liberibacter asiaticus]
MFALNHRGLSIDRRLCLVIGMSLSLCCVLGLEEMRNFLNFCVFLEKVLPSYCGVILAIFFFAIVGIYGASIGGHTRKVIDIVDSFIGFSIEKVRIIGNVETPEADIIHCLDLNTSTSLIFFDAIKIQKQLLALPWIAHAEIRRLYPDTMEIRLTERHPYAIWQNNSALYLIDNNGYVITAFNHVRFAYLPILIGENIYKAVRSFEVLSNIAGITKFVKAYNWIAERRWDLHLHNGIIIKLPEEKFDVAIAKILELQNKYQILDRDISVIDMRLPDRLSVRLTTGSFIDRRDIVDKRDQELKRMR